MSRNDWRGAGWLAVTWILISGCASIPEMDRARAQFGENKKIEAVKTLELALRGSNLLPFQRDNVAQMLDEYKESLADDAENAAAAIYKRSPNIRGCGDAAAYLKKFLAYDTDGGKIQTAIPPYEKLGQELRQRRDLCLKRADQSALTNGWRQAYSLRVQAEELDPDLPDGLDGLVEARNAYYNQAIRNAIKRGDAPETRRLTLALQSEVPPPEDAFFKPLIAEVSLFIRRNIAAKVEACVQAQNYFSAYDLLRRYPGLDPARLKEIKKTGSAYYLAKAKEELAAGTNRLGYAYFAIVKANELDGETPEIFDLHRDMADNIDKMININIAISGFVSPSQVPDAGPQFSDALIAYLVGRLPYRICILERAQIDKLLAEAEKAGGGYKQLSQQLSAEMLIVGNVSALDVEHQRSEQVVNEMVKTGTRREANPDYEQMMTQYGPNLNRWPYIPPATVEAPILERIPYKRGEERVKGLMVVSPRIFDAQGRITVAKEYKDEKEEHDSFGDAVPSANISADLLNLPTDNDIKEALRRELVAQVAETVIKAYEKRERRFWEQAEWFMGRREMDKALIQLALGHYYCMKDMANIDDRENNRYFKMICDAGLVRYTE